jgi:hypothetical protein
VRSLTDYIDGARLAVAAIALEGQEIVAQGLAITPESKADAIKALHERTMTYLIADRYRPELERALKGIAEYTKYFTEKNETVSTWPFGDAAEREKILKDVTDLMNDLKSFLDNLVHDGSIMPGTGLKFAVEFAPVIEAGDPTAIREAALKAVQDPSYSRWRDQVIRCEEVVSSLKLKFS